MKDILKTVFITLGVIVCAVALIGFGITAFVSWVWGGMRFSPEAAIEAVGITQSERPYIDADGYRFYYDTAEEIYGEEELCGLICEVTPVEQNNLGLWHAVTRPRTHAVTIEGSEEEAGRLLSVEIDGKYHNFFMPTVRRNELGEYEICAALADGYTTVTANGKQIEVPRNGYFVTEREITAFTVNGTIFIIHN